MEMIGLLEQSVAAGMHNAQSALSAMAGAEIRMSSPKVRVVPFAEVPSLAGAADSEVVGTYLSVEGDLCGDLMILLTFPSAVQLAEMVLGPIEGGIISDEMTRSFFAELGNVVGGAFLNGVAEHTSLTFVPSVPYVVCDFSGAILTTLFLGAMEGEEKAVVIDTQFQGMSQEIHGLLLLLPRQESFARALSEVSAQ